ncbi:MAG: AraC family transcriptional regulator [Tateyamaria sp.]|uniref:AraC family transcriptional regulator n=2 Tax=Tateyamaria sp. TaxID=1929288 RepID=UPI00329F6364
MAQRSCFLADRTDSEFAGWLWLNFAYGPYMSEVTSKLLDLIRVKGAAYIGKNLDPAWNMVVDEHQNLARFHLVLSGSTWIELPGKEKRERVDAGEFVIIPNGRKHALREGPNAQNETLHNIPDAEIGPVFERLNKEQHQTSILCGYFKMSSTAPPALISQLPSMLIERRNVGKRQDKIGLIVRLVEAELSRETAPHKAVLNRLTEILCIYAIHHWIEREILPDGRLNTLSDPRLHNVLNEIHEDPTAAWTVESLAKLCGLSRTAFAVYFKTALGMTPINYIVTWRVQVARQLLEDGELTLDEIAQKTGYTDVNAFNRAFKRVTGSSPGIFRRISRK